jgi:hypothetical protein
MTLNIIMLKNIFLLHTLNTKLPSNVSRCAMLYAIMYVNFHFRKLHKLMNNIILAINVHETLRPPGSSLGPLQIVYVALNTKIGVVECNSLHEIEDNINIIDGPIGKKIQLEKKFHGTTF